jgi:hypothetical protein
MWRAIGQPITPRPKKVTLAIYAPINRLLN